MHRSHDGLKSYVVRVLVAPDLYRCNCTLACAHNRSRSGLGTPVDLYSVTCDDPACLHIVVMSSYISLECCCIMLSTMELAVYYY